jgi:hypothetical protein
MPRVILNFVSWHYFRIMPLDWQENEGGECFLFGFVRNPVASSEVLRRTCVVAGPGRLVVKGFYWLSKLCLIVRHSPNVV